MDSDLGRSTGAVVAARLSATSLSARPAAAADVRAIAAHLRTTPEPSGPFTGKAALAEFGDLSDADLTTWLEHQDLDRWSSWPRRDLTFALVTLIGRLAAGSPRARRAGITLLAPIAGRRPTEVMGALETALRAADIPDAGLVSVVRTLRRALGAPPAPHPPGRTRGTGGRRPSDPAPSKGHEPTDRKPTTDRLTPGTRLPSGLGHLIDLAALVGGPSDRFLSGGLDRGRSEQLTDWVHGLTSTGLLPGKSVRPGVGVPPTTGLRPPAKTAAGPGGSGQQSGKGGTGQRGTKGSAGRPGAKGGTGRRGEGSGAGEPEDKPGAGRTGRDPDVPPVAASPAYPVVKVIGPGDRRGVAVVDTPFTVSVGIGVKAVGTVARTAVEVPDGAASLTVRLLYDPNSFTVPADAPTELSTAADALPLIITMTPVEDDDLNQLRRIGVAYFAGSQLVGLAWATVFVVPDLASAQSAQLPPAPNLRMLDLSVLQQPEPPDLVLALTYGDDAAVDRLVWAAFAGPTGPPIPDDGPQREDTASSADIAAFAKNLRTFVATEQAEDRVYLQLAGSAQKIAARISPAVCDVLRTLIRSADADRRPPPTVLLVSEELSIPWELADIGVTSAAGGSSPFLGAHVAISRWPLDVTDPPPRLVQAKSVASVATVADGFADVKDLAPLPYAMTEAQNLTDHYPPVTAVPADWKSFRALMSGDPPVDLIHLAVHGNFDPTGIGSGIYMIKSSKTTALGQTIEGARTPDLVTPEQIAVLTRTTTPFVFVNACQAGAAGPVLGDSSGMATSLLASGACGVVVSIWNINDVVAAEVAADFYSAVFDDHVGVGEALRRIRSRYTREAAGVQEKITSTLLGYQSFGHPGLRLTR